MTDQEFGKQRDAEIIAWVEEAKYVTPRMVFEKFMRDRKDGLHIARRRLILMWKRGMMKRWHFPGLGYVYSRGNVRPGSKALEGLMYASGTVARPYLANPESRKAGPDSRNGGNGTVGSRSGGDAAGAQTGVAEARRGDRGNGGNGVAADMERGNIGNSVRVSVELAAAGNEPVGVKVEAVRARLQGKPLVWKLPSR